MEMEDYYDDEEGVYYDDELDMDPEDGMLVDMGGGKVMHIDPEGNKQILYVDSDG